MTSSYYDLDDILSEEELIPCWTNFDFTYLAKLDPDYHPEDDKDAPDILSAARKIKMPIWAVKQWAPKGWVKMVLPRIYSRKAREKLEADPLQVDLVYVILTVSLLWRKRFGINIVVAAQKPSLTFVVVLAVLLFVILLSTANVTNISLVQVYHFWDFGKNHGAHFPIHLYEVPNVDNGNKDWINYKKT
jgi:hypothetical protein